jgi:hypothetical protein
MNLITRSDLLWCLSPNWIKRWRIRPLIHELNRRNALRNRAYPNATPILLVLDQLRTQDSDSLDRCWEKFNQALAWPDDTSSWQKKIEENAVRAERKRQLEEAEAETEHVISAARLDGHINDYTRILDITRPNPTFDTKEMK